MMRRFSYMPRGRFNGRSATRPASYRQNCGRSSRGRYFTRDLAEQFDLGVRVGIELAKAERPDVWDEWFDGGDAL